MEAMCCVDGYIRKVYKSLSLQKKLWTFSHWSCCTFSHNIEILPLLQFVEEMENYKETSLNQDFEFYVVFYYNVTKSPFDRFHQAVNYFLKAADNFCSVAYQVLPGGRCEFNPLSSAAVRHLSSHLSMV